MRENIGAAFEVAELSAECSGGFGRFARLIYRQLVQTCVDFGSGFLERRVESAAGTIALATKRRVTGVMDAVFSTSVETGSSGTFRSLSSTSFPYALHSLCASRIIV